MPDDDQHALPLPGLEQAPANLTPMVRALRRSVAAMDVDGLLEEEHALDLAAMQLLARSAEMKLATGRASTIANDVDLLLRIKKSITDPDVESGIDADLRALAEEFNRRIDEHDQAAP